MEKQPDQAANIRNIDVRIEKGIADSDTFKAKEKLFNLDETDQSRLNECKKKFINQRDLWVTTDDWQVAHNRWLECSWEDLAGDEVEQNVGDWKRLIIKSTKQFKNTAEMPEVGEIGDAVKANLMEFEPQVPLVMALRTMGMAERHWEDILTKTGVELKIEEPGFNFQKVIELGMLHHLDVCQEVSTRAEKEYKIREELDKMYNEWDSILFEFKPLLFTFKIVNFPDAMEKNDEHYTASQNLIFNP